MFVAYVYIWRKGGLDWSVGRPIERGPPERVRPPEAGVPKADGGRRCPLSASRASTSGATPEEVEEEVERGILLTTLDRAVGWARKQSMWPATFGLACCAIEMMSTGAGQYDLSRWGMELFRGVARARPT